MNENEIKKLELEIADLEANQKELQTEIDALGRQYTVGALGFFIGIFLVVIGWYWIGLLIGVAGMLSALTQGAKQRGKRKEISDLSQQISELRHKIRTLLG